MNLPLVTLPEGLSSEVAPDSTALPAAPVDIVEEARRQLHEQAEAISAIAERMGESFERAVKLIFSRSGRLVVCGMGKSGHIGRKIAATMSSTGTPAFFMHAGEALHGDLGMVTPEDVVLLISNSGETGEVIGLLKPLEEMGAPVVALSGQMQSTLARRADVCLDISVAREACHLNLAPTTSSLVTLAMGDALAVSLGVMRNLRPRDFAKFHPGGALGRKLSTRVKDVMRTHDLPKLRADASFDTLLDKMSASGCGTAVVCGGDECVAAGIVTDGDLRRALEAGKNLREMSVRELMNTQPIVILESALLEDARQLMRTRRIKVVLVVDATGRLQGLYELFS